MVQHVATGAIRMTFDEMLKAELISVVNRKVVRNYRPQQRDGVYVVLTRSRSVEHAKHHEEKVFREWLQAKFK
jgi:hypothetical protein